jgi:hypothetical protein
MKLHKLAMTFQIRHKEGHSVESYRMNLYFLAIAIDRLSPAGCSILFLGRPQQERKSENENQTIDGSVVGQG